MKLSIELDEETCATLAMITGKRMWEEGKVFTINSAAEWVVSYECKRIREKIEKRKERGNDRNIDRDGEENTTPEASSEGND